VLSVCADADGATSNNKRNTIRCFIFLFVIVLNFLEAAHVIPTDAADNIKTRETYRKASRDAKLFLLTDTHKEKAEKLQKGVLHDF
jgi:hypothetical protein